MTRSAARRSPNKIASSARSLALFFSVGAALAIAIGGSSGCKKPPPPPDDAAPPPAPIDAGTLDLAPLEDAGDDAADAYEAGHGTWTGPVGPVQSDFQARIRTCCALIQNQAANAPNGPQKFQLTNAANGCFAFANSAATAPELASARALAAQVKINCP